MKKGSKSKLLLTIFLLILAAVLTLLYVGIKLQCEVLTKEKVLAEEKLSAIKNSRVNLIAVYQYLTSEERIVDIAMNELGMIKNKEFIGAVSVDKERINKIAAVLKEKYE
jgi:cell division protein FtsB